MKKALWVVLGVIVLLVVLGSMGGGDEPEPSVTAVPSYLDEYGGQASVYQRIAGETDCAVLQEQFDIAAENAASAEPASAEHRWTQGYMAAADDRMKTVGCYD